MGVDRGDALSALRPSVRAAFYDTNAPIEAVIPYLYADVRRIPTIAVGVACFTLASAQALPLRRADGSLATREEIAADWLAVNGNAEAARRGHTYAAKLVKLHLSDADLRALVMRRLDANVPLLVARWPGFPLWPAVAQMALCNWAWACGAEEEAPRMSAALARGDFKEASKEVKLDETNNKGLVPRNILDKALLQQAARVVAAVGDYDSLEVPPVGAEDAPELDHLDDSKRAHTLALVASSMMASITTGIERDRSERE